MCSIGFSSLEISLSQETLYCYIPASTCFIVAYFVEVAADWLYTFPKNGYNMSVTIGINYKWKAGDCMPNGAEIIKEALNDFQKVQKRMLIAKEENAIKTYADLKDDYISLKALLTSLGVNLSEVDKIKE